MSNLFESYNRKISINGHDLEVLVSVFVAEDDIDPAGDFDFGNAAENAAYLKRFKSGELFIGVIHVQSTAVGLKGHAYLGGCHLRSNNYFDHKPFETDVRALIESHGMVEESLEDLTKNIISEADKLSRFSTGKAET